jgi:hypothetical protein
MRPELAPALAAICEDYVACSYRALAEPERLQALLRLNGAARRFRVAR